MEGLFTLPGRDKPLALLNLLRGQSMDLPSGQDVARFLGARPLTPEQLGTNTLNPTPLWFYLLKEAEARANGMQLGPAGGRIVAEVVLGLLKMDKTSWVNVEPAWRTTVPRASDYATLAELINYATT